MNNMTPFLAILLLSGCTSWVEQQFDLTEEEGMERSRAWEAYQAGSHEGIEGFLESTPPTAETVAVNFTHQECCGPCSHPLNTRNNLLEIWVTTNDGVRGFFNSTGSLVRAMLNEKWDGSVRDVAGKWQSCYGYGPGHHETIPGKHACKVTVEKHVDEEWTLDYSMKDHTFEWKQVKRDVVEKGPCFSQE